MQRVVGLHPQRRGVVTGEAALGICRTGDSRTGDSRTGDICIGESPAVVARNGESCKEKSRIGESRTWDVLERTAFR